MPIIEPPVWGYDQLFLPYVDSMNRAFEMLEVFDEATTSEQIWRLFQVAWPTCDTVPYFVVDDLLEVLPRQAPYGVAYLEGKDAEFYAGLPESFIVYRGCRPTARDGLSWTTDVDVALLFAQGHRGVTIPEGVVYRTRVDKSDIFTVMTDRDESTIVLNPYRLPCIRKFKVV
jgi:hypothetical protein